VTVAFFGSVDAALIEPLPNAYPGRLADVAESTPLFPRSNLSRADYQDWKRMNTTLSSLDVFGGKSYLIVAGSTNRDRTTA
jgi:macrolide transport system ATP-binding/permease protein